MRNSAVTQQELFTRVAKPEIQRSTFNRSHGNKTTFNAGWVMPVFIDEALPGDTFTLNATLFGRLATPLKPIMDNIVIDAHFFSVPYRLVWDNWQRFNGEQTDPDDTTDYLIPTISAPAGGFASESIYDYLGIPTLVDNVEVSALPLRAYNLIWNEWYRDENLQPSLQVPKGDGPDIFNIYDIQPRGKRKDYFTSALPWAQKADPVVVPLGNTAPVIQNATAAIPLFSSQSSGSTGYLFTASNGTNSNIQLSSNGIATNALQWEDPNLMTDLSDASTITINLLREAFQIQKLYEKDARGGTRYTELIRSHFGVTSPDARLQRPEYLGGGSSYVNVSPVAQTSGTGDTTDTPQGNLSAMGTFTSNRNGFVKSFTEHEIIIGVVSARADLNYQQGLNRMWSRQTRFDFFWPSLAHLGEQAILNKEINLTGDSEYDEGVFGYQERYAEYRYKPSTITGRFRSNFPTSLDFWHLAQDFEGEVSLNPGFIQENPPIGRIIAVPSEPQFLLDTFFNLTCARPMPTFAIPGLVDHF